MTRIADLDESQRTRSYAVAALTVDHVSVQQVRRQLRQVAPRRGSSRRHFVKESDREKKLLLAAFRTLPGATCTVAVVTGSDRPVDQRAVALGRLVSHLVSGGLDRIVFDHVDDIQQRRDRQTLAVTLSRRDVTYAFEPAQSTEPLLWAPDAVAWCVGRPEWRHRLDGWVQVVG